MLDCKFLRVHEIDVKKHVCKLVADALQYFFFKLEEVHVVQVLIEEDAAAETGDHRWRDRNLAVKPVLINFLRQRGQELRAKLDESFGFVLC